MQATVLVHDPGGRTQVVTDDGLVHEVAPPVVAASGLRLLRAGQRVSITITAEGVTRLWVIGIGEGEVIR